MTSLWFGPFKRKMEIKVVLCSFIIVVQRANTLTNLTS